jgi:two-component system NarL family sensor kinase
MASSTVVPFAGSERRRPTLRLGRPGPLIALVLAAVAAVSLIGVVLIVVLHHAGIDHERREAELATRIASSVVIGPLITPALLRGEPAALAKLDGVVRQQILQGPVERVKLWSEDGRIVYSDEARLIGQRFPLDTNELVEVLASGGVTSELSDHSRPENRFEPGQEALLETYARVLGPDGAPMLFETYYDFESIAADGGNLFLVVLPALGGGLLLLGLANVAAAGWFARYVRRRDQQRTALLAKALDASNSERRRLSADLHDGVVQDLTAAWLAVENTARPLRGGAIDATSSMLDDVAETMRRSVRTLRTLLMDLYPADLEARGLPAALHDLVELTESRGLLAELRVSPSFWTPTPAAGLLYRVAQEAVRNATAHARARRVAISVGDDGGVYWIEVSDDGEGFDIDGGAPEGHFGIRAVRDLLADAGGRLSVQSTPGQGSVVRAELPYALTRPARPRDGRPPGES